MRLTTVVIVATLKDRFQMIIYRYKIVLHVIPE